MTSDAYRWWAPHNDTRAHWQVVHRELLSRERPDAVRDDIWSLAAATFQCTGDAIAARCQKLSLTSLN